MRLNGTLTQWNDDRGFGFITPSQGGSDVFVHISAFPKDGRRPALGERLTFEIDTGTDGKTKATKLLCPGRPVREPSVRQRGNKPNLFRRVASITFVIALAVYGYGEYFRYRAVRSAVAVEMTGKSTSSDERSQSLEAFIEPTKETNPLSFGCDGRTHCSQMTSCAEATFFLRSCPGVEMDGDNDGIPCEQQWCS